MERSRQTILLVEDESAHVELVQRAFEPLQASHQLSVVGSVEHAKSFLEDHDPSLVILDFRLPDGCGLELLPGPSHKSKYPMIVMTAYGDEKVAVEAMKAGAIDYVVKSHETLLDMPHIADRAIREWELHIDREKADHALRESEERLSSVMNASLDAIIMIDDQGIIIGWNPQATTLFGWSRADALGRQLSDLIIPSRYVQSHLKGIRRFQETGEQSILNQRIEMSACRKDAKEFPIELVVAPIHSQGKQVFCGFIQDISARKEAEHRQQSMINELDHRVKNNLASVLALMEQTVQQADSLEAFVNVYSGRILAMSRTHELMALSRWKGVDLKKMILSIMEPYQNASKPNIHLDGNSVILPAFASAPVSMALYELASNAVRHGVLSISEGSLTIKWSQNQEGSLSLQWNETGGSGICQPSHTGSGIKLIRGLIEFELHGTIVWEFLPSGLKCSLSIPLQEAPAVVRDPARSRSRESVVQG